MIPDHVKLTFIMAVYNEKDTVLKMLDRVLQLPINKEVILIDNCSTDGTRDILSSIRSDQVKVILQPQNLGKGTSIRTGVAHAGGDYIVIQDADEEYEPEQVPLLLEKALAENLDAVFGSRTLGGRAVYVYLKNYLGVLGINFLINALFGSHYTDTATACKLIRASVFKALPLQRTGFDLDFEICTKLALGGYSYGEVPIRYHPRTVAQGKKLRAFRDGWAALKVILYDRFVWRPPSGSR